ncbi:MAG TPA: FHA domain-containing protein [Anaerohalosphaeraceae bacterium]|nr:FHA domain-containing protein [Anaerohalosphaeraceae bacterium]
MAKLTILTGPLRRQSFELDPKDWPKIIGRTRDKAHFFLPDPAVSRQHAELSFRDGQWLICDLNSSNGTFLNEQRITHPVQLHNQDQIRCGGTVLLFETGEPLPAAEAARLADDQRIELVFDPGETMVAVAFSSLQSKQAAARRQRMLEAAQAAMNLSHGIKNILQALRTGIDVMDQSFRQDNLEQARKSWAILRRNLGTIEKFVLDMLKFTQDEKPRLQPCQINRLAETVIELLRPQAQQRSVALIAQLDDQIGLVPLDPDRMQDVLMNLLLNALEAVPPQTGQVTLTTELDAAGHLLIRVQDNGPGIENPELLFRPFHSTKGHMGTGLGLAIAKKVVSAHNGTIDVQTLRGEGTVFTVRIPLPAASEKPQNKPQE